MAAQIASCAKAEMAGDWLQAAIPRQAFRPDAQAQGDVRESQTLASLRQFL